MAPPRTSMLGAAPSAAPLATRLRQTTHKRKLTCTEKEEVSIGTESLWTGPVVTAPAWLRAAASAAVPPGASKVHSTVHDGCAAIDSGEVAHGAGHCAVGTVNNTIK